MGTDQAVPDHVVFVFVFGKLAKLPSEGVPYPLLVFAALLPWQFFSNAFTEAGNSLIGNANMISKVYFPRLVVPTSAVIVSFVDFLISGIILVGLMFWYGFAPDWRICTLPLFIFIAFAAAMGAGLWIAALNVKYRDFRYIIPLWHSSDFMFRRSGSAATSSPNSGGYCIPSIRWWA